MKTRFHLFIAVLCAALLQQAAAVEIDALPLDSAVPGGVALVPTGGHAISAQYRNNRVLLAEHESDKYRHTACSFRTTASGAAGERG